MINKLPADDLFEKSSMTFGEHLEELRRALGKAMIWLGIGTAVGLLLAKKIVTFIETPLKAAITGYYVERGKLEFEEANGVKPSEELALWMTKNNMQPQRAYVDPFTITDITNPKLPDPSKAEVEVIDQSEISEKLEQNPWKDMNIDRLNNLKPFILWQPIPNKLIALTSMEPFMMWMKAGIVAGIIFSAPGVFYHIWQFFAAGLYPHERRYVYWYLPLSLALFFAGVALAFFVIFKLILEFLIGYSGSLDVEFAPRLNDYMTFAMMLPLGFGLAFQLPIVMLGLHRFGVITAETYLSQWRIAVLVISFLAMILTPADPYSMIGLALPLIVLYFLGILLCNYMPKGAGFGSAAVDP